MQLCLFIYYLRRLLQKTHFYVTDATCSLFLSRESRLAVFMVIFINSTFVSITSNVNNQSEYERLQQFQTLLCFYFIFMGHILNFSSNVSDAFRDAIVLMATGFERLIVTFFRVLRNQHFSFSLTVVHQHLFGSYIKHIKMSALESWKREALVSTIHIVFHTHHSPLTSPCLVIVAI